MLNDGADRAMLRNSGSADEDDLESRNYGAGDVSCEKNALGGDAGLENRASTFDATMEDGDLTETPRDIYKVGPNETGATVQTAPPIHLHKPSVTDWVKIILMSAVMGIVFGIAFSRSRVFEPMVIRGQFIFANFIMLKMFLAAVGTSALCFLIISLTPFKARLERTRRKRVTSRGIRTTILGAFILGIGLAISAACPGMVLAQVGAGTSHSGYTLLGGILGALLFQWTDPIIKPITDKYGGGKMSEEYLDTYIGMNSSVAFAGLFIMMTAAVVLFEVFLPWQNDLTFPLADTCSTDNVNDCYAWPPSLGGVLIGLLQLPVFWVMGGVLGSSTSYVAVCSAWWFFLPKDYRHLFEYAKRFAHPQIDTHWQLIFVVFSILGALISESASGMLGKVHGVSIGYSLVGGILLVFGARMAGGCTSGHGVSGMALLSMHSIAATASMFAGGIATGFIIQYGIDDSFYTGA